MKGTGSVRLRGPSAPLHSSGTPTHRHFICSWDGELCLWTNSNHGKMRSDEKDDLAAANKVRGQL